MHPLSLSVTPGNWHYFNARKGDPTFRALAKKIMERDKYTCQFCGFQAREYQEVVNLDKNYRHNTPQNMVTACCFCTQCFFLEAIGMDGFGGGSLIYLPELSQPELNSLCHVLFCAITNATSYKETAQSVYRSLKLRTKYIEEHFGEGTSNPSVFGQLLVEYVANGQETDEKLFESIRLLPSRAKFREQIERWAASALEEMGTQSEQEATKAMESAPTI